MIFSSVDGFLCFTLSFSIFSSSFIICCFLFSLFVPCGHFDLFLCCQVSSALLFHSLSVPLLSLSFVSCFLFLFPVVVLCLFNPFSLSISFHFFPLSLFCFSMLLYPLCSALSLSLLYSTLLFFLLVFYSRLPGLPGRQVAGSPGRRVAGLPGTTASLPSSLPLRLGLCALEATRIYCQSPRRKWEFSSSPFKVFILQSKEIVSEKRESEKKEDPSRSRKRGSDPNSEMHDDAASFQP